MNWYLGEAQNPFNQEMRYSGYITNRRTKEHHKVAKKSAQIICDMLNDSEKDKQTITDLQDEIKALKAEVIARETDIGTLFNIMSPFTSNLDGVTAIYFEQDNRMMHTPLIPQAIYDNYSKHRAKYYQRDKSLLDAHMKSMADSEETS